MVLGLGQTLGETYRVTAFDRPGHGVSGRASQDGSLRTQARALREALQALGLHRPIVVGHSVGASLALTMALDAPDELSGIVALAPSCSPNLG